MKNNENEMQQSIKTGIYKITNPNGKVYIGQSIDIDKRWNKYKVKNCKPQIRLYNSLNKYKPENHVFEVIEKCLLEQLNEREIYWIEKLKCVENGLNIRKMFTNTDY